MPTQKTITMKATDRHTGLTPAQLSDFLADLDRTESEDVPIIKAQVTVGGRLKEISATVLAPDEVAR
jgi:hypothetical protein